MRTHQHRAASLVALACTAALLAACSGGGQSPSATDGGSSAPASAVDTSGIPRGFVNVPDAGEPQTGGTINYTLAVAADSLDPAGEFGAGSAGGSELTALYDLLVRYDYAEGKYVPQLAKSFEPNDDFSTWTVTLRDGVNFTDGTPLNAEAVKFSVERYLATSGGWSALLKESLASVSVVDDSTVLFTLTRPWADFPFMLAQAPGNIVSPAGVAAAGDQFVRTPVGAGPFMLESWKPGEELSLVPNPNYWGGKPYLDKLRFTVAATTQALNDLVRSGGTDVTQIRDTQIVRGMLDDKLPGFVDVTNTANILYINNAADRPGGDVNIRLAIAKAIDPEVIDQRTSAGAGLPGSEVFQPGSRWANDEGSVTYDAAGAAELVKEAKAGGYDGKLNLVTGPTLPEMALTIQAMLNAAGFDATISTQRTGQDLITAVLINKDFDIAVYGAAATDDPGDVFTRYYDRIGRPGNFLGYDNPEMSKALLDFSATADEDEKKALTADIQRIWNESMPFLPLAAQPVLLTWQPKVHGVEPSTQFQILFDKAWVEQ